MEWMKWMQWWLNGRVNEWMNEKNKWMKWMERMTWHGMEWNEANETAEAIELTEQMKRIEGMKQMKRRKGMKRTKGMKWLKQIKAMKHMKAMKRRNDRSLLRKPKKNHSEAKNQRFKNENVQFSEIKMNDTETKAVLLQKLTERFRNQRRRNSETQIQKPKRPTEIPKRPLLICYTWSMTRDQPHHSLWTTRCILSTKRDQSSPVSAFTILRATAAVKNKFQTADKKGVKCIGKLGCWPFRNLSSRNYREGLWIAGLAGLWRRVLLKVQHFLE